MHMKRRMILIITLGLLGCSGLAKKPVAGGEQHAEEVIAIATDAYIYGYPLVKMDLTRKQMTNVGIADESDGEMGRLMNTTTFPAVGSKAVAAPNADVLYTTAWVDVSKEPWIFSIPAMGDRYYVIQLLDGWTNVFQVVGKRTTGGRAQTFAVTGPGWLGGLPAGVTEYKSPTGMVWMRGRIYCSGTTDDYRTVHALQDKLSLVSLRSYDKSYSPPEDEAGKDVDAEMAVRDQIDNMDLIAYFKYLAQLMKKNHPAVEDAPIVARMAKIGLVPGQDFDQGKLMAFPLRTIAAVPPQARVKIRAQYFKQARSVNGWMSFAQTGVYGTDYLARAFVADASLGASRRQDAVFITAEKDASGKDFDGASKKYVLHLNKDQMPPVDGFWSLTMYNAMYSFVPNPLNRYNLSQRDKLATNADGSVDIYLQRVSPGKLKEANWLPTPEEKFVPMLRLYWPRETPPSTLDGTWNPPAIEEAR